MSRDLRLVLEENKLYLRTEDDVDRTIQRGLLSPDMKPQLLEELQGAQGGIVIVTLRPNQPDLIDDPSVDRPNDFISYH